MPFRRLYTILALIICLLIYLRIRNRKNTLGYIIITTIIASAIYNFIIPSDMSIVDMFDNKKEISDDTGTINPSITLDSASLELISGDIYDLTAKISPNDMDINWFSDNTNIVAVDNNGRLEAINEGNATVSAVINYNGSEYKDTCYVGVKAPAIDLESTYLLCVGEIQSLTANTIPEKSDVFWNSNDLNIVTINDDGRIEGINEGTGIITATMIYNDKTYSADCIITVEESPDKEPDFNSNDNTKDAEQEVAYLPDTIETEDGRVPLSSAVFVGMGQGRGYLVNNNYSTLQGTGYQENYIATSAGINYNEVISVCSFSPFQVIYNLESKYNNLSGEIAFDDMSLSQFDIVGVTSSFKGEAEIIFYVDDIEKERITLTTTDFPKSFFLDVSGGNKLSIVFSFPYTSFVLENFDKYFNIINAYLE